jgi:hypothetical protein
MNVTHYIGFDVHKKSVSYCVKTGDGRIVEEGKLAATRQALRRWAQPRTQPWHGGDLPPHVPQRLFRGWPAGPNSIFADSHGLFPQMDVWSRGRVDPFCDGSAPVHRGALLRTSYSPSGRPSTKYGEKSALR